MKKDEEHSFHFEALLLAVLAGVLFCVVHLLNGWLLSSFEISDHISFLYLPSFLRLVNVLVLGMVWGSLGTAIGCLLLMPWSQDTVFLSLVNATASAGCAALAVMLMRFMQKRPLSLARFSDLLSLALLYALLNALIHHALWSMLDPSQLVNPNQLAFMMVGDINGAVIGALVLRWLARHTRLVAFARTRATQAPLNETDSDLKN
ncbi:hypothetical protein C5F52_27265 [Limnohabitans sp. TS-CS-82]|uniref:hypothetical protein n=1 Tax=Limnohabitans sp. TS-CS-82 TaxID=2094193 RepID=UPI000CF1EF55|nr:hypothetical protein [Limnohabitans sp. TS-CS-82]PQA80074.1 hypothetical protein C5F52_27265 [Limnohabitans sp. TS-CS-82]